MTKLKLAVIGAGHLGRIHAKLLSAMDDIELVGVVDPVAAAREQVAADCRTQAYADHHSLLDVVDGAVIATPTKYHHAVALDFLRRGIPLMIEKPITTTLAQADELLDTARLHGVNIQVGHIERFNPALVAALPFVRQPKFIEATRASNFTFRSTDVGVVLDLMIHDLDVAISLAAAPVRSVSAIGVAVVGRHEDVAHARIEFTNGCVANLNASRVSPVGKRQMQVWSAQGFATIDFGGRTANVLRPSESLLRRELDIESYSPEQKTHMKDHLFAEHLPTETLTVEPANAMIDELQDFAGSIRAKREPRVNGEQGREALRVAEMIVAQINSHAWNGDAAGPVGPLAMIPSHAAPKILRGPHWDRSSEPKPERREAG